MNGSDKWYDLLCCLYMVALNNKDESIKCIDKLLLNDYYPDEIKEALKVLKKGFEEK